MKMASNQTGAVETKGFLREYDVTVFHGAHRKWLEYLLSKASQAVTIRLD